ncbi:hypothetical protein SZ54_3639 [Rhizobium sp. UR51a]|nr:hypothetical protein SZ54_3639 [Rhizobium sp. UR51a]
MDISEAFCACLRPITFEVISKFYGVSERPSCLKYNNDPGVCALSSEAVATLQIRGLDVSCFDNNTVASAWTSDA